MKRSEMVELLSRKFRSSHGHVDDSCDHCDERAEETLTLVEEQGMLPPTQTCKLVPDDLRGGIKHGPSERVWDEE